jgi:hypothetical protein
MWVENGKIGHTALKGMLQDKDARSQCQPNANDLQTKGHAEIKVV